MTEASSEVPEQTSKAPLSKRAARYSLLAPLVSLLINHTVGAGMVSRAGTIAVGCVSMLIILMGLSCAVIALFGIRKHGKKGILVPAVAGLLINGLFVAGSIMLIDTLHTVKMSRMMSKEELISLPDVLPNSVKIIDTKLGFRFELPEGFYEFKEGYGNRAIIHSYVKFSPRGERAFVINVERLGGIVRDLNMPESAMKQVLDVLPSGSQVERMELTWKGRTIEGVTSIVPVNGQRVTSYSVQIPLKLEAIQISLATLPGMEAEAKTVLTQVLNSLAGKAIWE